MIDSKDALNRLQRANLLPPGAVLEHEELAASVAECERRVARERGAAGTAGRRTEESLRPVPGSRPRWRPALVFSLAFLALVVLVGTVALLTGSDSLVLEPDVANTSPPTTSGMIGNVAYIDRLVYYEDVDRTLHTAVYFPAEGDGPWPVVIVYSEHRRRAQDQALARRIAERGAVAFAPVWVDEYAATATEYLAGAMWERAACVVGYAQAQADSYGGDPVRTTVVGAAGGEHPAAWVALGLADSSICAEPILYQPSGLVAGLSQWLFQEEQFDPAYAAEDSVAIDTVDRFFSPERWNPADELSVFLWATAWSDNSNQIEDPPSVDSWVWSRDPDGDIVEDLAAVGAFADGLITYGDNARLMELRMLQAGIDVTYSESDAAGYSLDDSVFESLWQLVTGR